MKYPVFCDKLFVFCSSLVECIKELRNTNLCKHAKINFSCHSSEEKKGRNFCLKISLV